MRLHADASVKRQLVRALHEAGVEISSQFEMDPAAPDESVLEAANARQAVLLTEDKDFGELVFRRRLHAGGVVLARLPVADAAAVSMVVGAILAAAPRLEGAFVVVSKDRTRIRPLP